MPTHENSSTFSTGIPRKSGTMSAWITHVGHALPGRALPQAEVIDWLQRRLAPGVDPQRLRRFAQRAGVVLRHAAIDLLGPEGDAMYPVGLPHADTLQRNIAFSRLAAPLAVAAVRAACPEGLGTITHLVVATCTGAVAPGLDLQLIELLGLQRSVRRTMVGFMGCYAALPALRIAADAVRADPTARVLVVCCELSSLHFQTGPADDALVAACLFGDGAAAAVVAGSATGTRLQIRQDACVVVPETADAMAWTAAADGFRLRLAANVASALAVGLPSLNETLLAGVPRENLQWIVHPGGPRILDSVESTMVLPRTALSASRAALAQAGNRSSATVLAILSDVCQHSWVGPVVIYAFGPGLTAEGLVLERI